MQDPDVAAPYRELGALIVAARKRKGLLQKDVSGTLGVSEGSVIAWEGGKARPSNHYAALARLLGLEEELLRLMGDAANARMRAKEQAEKADELARQIEQHLDDAQRSQEKPG